MAVLFQNKNTLLAVFIWLIVTACGAPQRNWHYQVPKDYQGFLVIRFGCKDGKDVTKSGHAVLIRYSNQGVACTGASLSEFVPRVGNDVCDDSVGNQIPLLVNGTTQGAGPTKALCGGETSSGTINGQVFEWYIMWIGDPKAYARFRNSEQYHNDLNQFLNVRFQAGL
jgi:hypothetical protein